MRNAIDIGNGFIVTTDNSGGIGEKERDVVAAPDRITAHYAARVALLEQWAAHAEPMTVLLHNFTGDGSWISYVEGVKDLFHEAGLEVPPIRGSSETNMELLQSAVAVTMVGKRKRVEAAEDLEWYTYGTPLVGQDVLERSKEIASVRLLWKAIEAGVVHRIWPVGSRGVLEEVRMMTGNSEAQVETTHPSGKSAGPATIVILGIQAGKREEAAELLGPSMKKIRIFS